jgi:ligand-binding sensor domain-containing protein
VWVGSAQGVARLAGPGEPRLYTVADGLPEGGVIDLAVAADGMLWAASSSAVARFDGETWRTYELGVPDAQIQAIAPGIGKVWLAGKRGVHSLFVP